jgi:ribonucleoside-diphosphate reductase alpha chain
VIETIQGRDIAADPKSIPSAAELARQLERDDVAPTLEIGGGERHGDAPMCMQCGVQMQRAGSCHACPSCGSTSGCS